MNKSIVMNREFTDTNGVGKYVREELSLKRTNTLENFFRKFNKATNLELQTFKSEEEISAVIDTSRGNSNGSDPVSNEFDNHLINKLGQKVFDFYRSHVVFNADHSIIIEKNQRLSSLSELNNVSSVISLELINNYRLINKHLEEVNSNLPNDGILLGSFETFTARAKKRILCDVPVLNKICSGLDFVINRVLPKLPYVKKVYFSITKGKNRLLSKAEALGRLVCCGFEIVELKEINDIYYFVAKKVKEPAYDMNPSYGPLFKMKRVGKNGKIIGVYKFRTMHPYSEYLQDYVLKLNGYGANGKPANDFRVVPWAKVLRRYWLDELPQLINVFKGEMKLVGIRPVSQTYFNGIPEDIQKLRVTQKPGCIPPYVALNRISSVDSVLQAEKEYLIKKTKNPYFTDTKFFVSAIYNILFKRKRSA